VWALHDAFGAWTRRCGGSASQGVGLVLQSIRHRSGTLVKNRQVPTGTGHDFYRCVTVPTGRIALCEQEVGGFSLRPARSDYQSHGLVGCSVPAGCDVPASGGRDQRDLLANFHPPLMSRVFCTRRGLPSTRYGAGCIRSPVAALASFGNGLRAHRIRPCAVREAGRHGIRPVLPLAVLPGPVSPVGTHYPRRTWMDFMKTS
jgi:hypothetical protein